MSSHFGHDPLRESRKEILGRPGGTPLYESGSDVGADIAPSEQTVATMTREEAEDFIERCKTSIGESPDIETFAWRTAFATDPDRLAMVSRTSRKYADTGEKPPIATKGYGISLVEQLIGYCIEHPADTDAAIDHWTKSVGLFREQAEDKGVDPSMRRDLSGGITAKLNSLKEGDKAEVASTAEVAADLLELQRLKSAYELARFCADRPITERSVVPLDRLTAALEAKSENRSYEKTSRQSTRMLEFSKRLLERTLSAVEELGGGKEAGELSRTMSKKMDYDELGACRVIMLENVLTYRDNASPALNQSSLADYPAAVTRLIERAFDDPALKPRKVKEHRLLLDSAVTATQKLSQAAISSNNLYE